MLSLFRLRSVAYFLIALSYYPSSSAEPTLSKEPLILQIRTIDVAPYGFESTDGYQGIYYELAHSLARKLINLDHIQINHQVYPYARIIHELKKGQTDLTIMFKYKELETYVTYLTALPSLENVVIGLEGREFKKISDLEGKKIAYLRGAKFSDAIDNNDNIIKVETHNFRQGIDMLIAKRVDAIIGPIDPIVYAAQELKGKEVSLGMPLVVSTRTPWLQISNSSNIRHSIDQVKEYFAEILATGKLDSLRKKYSVHRPTQ